MIRIALLKNGNLAIPARHIETLMGGVIPKIVGVADSLHAGHDFARLGVEDNQLGRVAAADEKAMVHRIQRHRIKWLESLHLPFVEHEAFVFTRYRDIAQRREIGEYPSSAHLHLK